MSKFGLGKGLGALIPEHQQYYDAAKNPVDIGGSITIVPLSRLKPNPDQPRKTFPDGSIEELADSIRKHGLLQPIIAEAAGEGEFVIIAGERRFRAASRAGLSEVPVIVRAVSSEKRLQLSLIENIQREDLNPMEEAQAYNSLMELTGYTQEQVAEAVGKNRSTVANALRMLRLSDAMQSAVRDGIISAGHARSLLAVSDHRAREALFARICRRGALGPPGRIGRTGIGRLRRWQESGQEPKIAERRLRGRCPGAGSSRPVRKIHRAFRHEGGNQG